MSLVSVMFQASSVGHWVSGVERVAGRGQQDAEDEILVVVSGEAFITDEKGEEHRLGPGDMGFFPAGSSCIWRITDHVRKFAMVRTTLPGPLALALRIWNKLRRMMGRPSESPLTRAVLALSGM